MEIDKLVRMANQIATNMNYGPDQDKIAAGVADHITRFWTPSMRTLIIREHRTGLPELSPLAARAVERLVEPKSTTAA